MELAPTVLGLLIGIVLVAYMDVRDRADRRRRKEKDK